MNNTILVTGGAGFIGSHTCVGRCWADTRLANRMLGWQASRTLADMCADTWRWWNKVSEANIMQGTS